jgi:hypothetical protein
MAPNAFSFSTRLGKVPKTPGDPVKQELLIGKSSAEEAADAKLSVGRWLGRHEALDMVARGCSGVDAACLKKVRDEKLYLDVASNWDQFCTRQLHVSRRKIDGMIRRLDEFGPAYFDLSRLTHVTADEYRQIAPAVSAEGVKIAGEVVTIAPGNKDKLDAAVAAVRRKRSKPAPEKKSFKAVLDACEAALALIDNPPIWPDALQKLLLAGVLIRMRKSAEGLGAVTIDVRL